MNDRYLSQLPPSYALWTADRSVMTASPAATDAVRLARILLVEDDMAVRAVFAKALRAEGYDVEDARSGGAALALLDGGNASFDLLITDVVMPGMNGRELSERAKELQPALRVLFVSGYADDEILRRGLLYGEVELLAKPFTLDVLTGKVKELLARAP